MPTYARVILPTCVAAAICVANAVAVFASVCISVAAAVAAIATDAGMCFCVPACEKQNDPQVLINREE